MTETIRVKGKISFDRFGRPIRDSADRTISGCVIGMHSQSDVDGAGVIDGDATSLDVFAPAGTVLTEGTEVDVRGKTYVVVNVPFDWSVGRRPVNRLHQPRVQFVVERKEA